jgi:hypothetical protein
MYSVVTLWWLRYFCHETIKVRNALEQTLNILKKYKVFLLESILRWYSNNVVIKCTVCCLGVFYVGMGERGSVVHSVLLKGSVARDEGTLNAHMLLHGDQA